MLRTYFVGVESERDVPVLTDGARLNNATLSMQESQLDKQQTYTTKQIAQVTGVDPHFLFDDSEGKYNATVTQAGEDVVRYTFRPLLDVIEDELTTKLHTEADQAMGYTIHCDPNALLRGDIQTQAAVYVSLKAAGIINANDVRQGLGYPKSDDPEADKLKTSGDTSKTLPTPTSTPQASDEPVKSATPEHPERASFADALKPLLADACERVDAKTDKAFEKKTDKITPVWVNVFAGEQERFAHEALKPVAVALEKLGGEGIDVDRVAQRYAASIRKRASDGTVISLATIVTEVTGGKDERPADE
jgi:Phage portal protein